MNKFLLRLNLQTFSEDAPSPDSWGELFSEMSTESVDDQPLAESEETVPNEEPVTESDELTDLEEGEEQLEETEETEEEPLFNDETDIDLGEGRQPVKLAELKNGYLRQADYTKKTQALADERKAFEALQQEYEPVKGWLDYINSNPYLFNQINEFINTWNNLGEATPLEDVLNTEAGPYINHLLAENNRLSQELDQINGEYQTTRFESDMRTLVSDLKAEYGDLITPEYESSLRQQAQEQGLSPDVLKRIAKGDLAEQKLQQTQQESKKVEAKTKQKIRETKLPPQPKKTAQQPNTKEVEVADDWGSFFRSLRN